MDLFTQLTLVTFRAAVRLIRSAFAPRLFGRKAAHPAHFLPRPQMLHTMRARESNPDTDGIEPSLTAETLRRFRSRLTPSDGFEPPTTRLTGARSAAELRRQQREVRHILPLWAFSAEKCRNSHNQAASRMQTTDPAGELPGNESSGFLLQPPLRRPQQCESVAYAMSKDVMFWRFPPYT